MSRYAGMVVSWFVVLSLSVAVIAGEAPADKAPAEKKPAKAVKMDKPADTPDLRYVPNKGLDIVGRFFELGAKQTSTLTDLRQELLEERKQAMAELEKTLDKKFEAKVLASLSEEQKAEYTKVRAAINAYYEANLAAEAEFKKVHAEVGGKAIPYVPTHPDQLVHQIPDLSSQEKKAVQTITMESRRKVHQEVTKAMTESSVSRPKRGDRAGWGAYHKARAQITKEVTAKLEADKRTTIAGALSPENAKKFETLASALETLNAKREANKAALSKALVETVGAERLKPRRFESSYRPRPGGAHMHTQGGVTKPK